MLKYKISRQSAQWEPSCSMWTDGRTNTTKLIVAFRNCANAPETCSRFLCIFTILIMWSAVGHVRACIAVQKVTRHLSIDMVGCNYVRQRRECLGPVLVFDCSCGQGDRCSIPSTSNTVIWPKQPSFQYIPGSLSSRYLELSDKYLKLFLELLPVDNWNCFHSITGNLSSRYLELFPVGTWNSFQ